MDRQILDILQLLAYIGGIFFAYKWGFRDGSANAHFFYIRYLRKYNMADQFKANLEKENEQQA